MKWVVGNCPSIHSAVGNCTGSATFKCGASRVAHCFTQHLRLKCPVMWDQHCEPLLRPTPQAPRPGNAGSAKRAFRFTQHLRLEGLVMWDQRCQPQAFSRAGVCHHWLWSCRRAVSMLICSCMPLTCALSSSTSARRSCNGFLAGAAPDDVAPPADAIPGGASAELERSTRPALILSWISATPALHPVCWHTSSLLSGCW